MSTLSLLYQRSYAVNDQIRVLIPTVGEILRDEDAYYKVVQFITAQPIDFMVPLDDMGIDFSMLSEWELFILLLPAISEMDTSLVLEGINLKDFKPMVEEQSRNVVLIDQYHGVVIDRKTHAQIAATLRKIHHMEANRRKPANEEAKKYMLERARVKAKRHRKNADASQLESLIVAMVNTEQFKYDFESTLSLSIFQFNESVRQVIKKVDYDNRMYGVYAGTINAKELSQDDLNWLVHK